MMSVFKRELRKGSEVVLFVHRLLLQAEEEV
jgi:hypothetical protein